MSANARRDPLLIAVRAGLDVYDLSQPMFVGMPQSPNHPRFQLGLHRRHGDITRSDGSSAASEMIVTGGHVGTHIDALAHVSCHGMLFGKVDALAAQLGGRFASHGVDTITPMVCTGVLLDVASALGGPLDAGYEISAKDLLVTLERQGTAVRAGDVALIRTGWAQRFGDADAFVGRASGVPGPGEEAARLLAGWQPRAVGADSIAFEHLPAGRGHAELPAHKILIVDNGVYIIEALNLEALAKAGVHEFVFVLTPLLLIGATGSPVRPLAVVSRDEQIMAPEMER